MKETIIFRETAEASLNREIEIREYGSETDYQHGFVDGLKRAELLISLMLSEMQWTPCSKKLPDVHEEVYVTCKGHDLIIPQEGETIIEAVERIGKMRWVTTAFLDEDGYWCEADFGGPLMVNPIAWMPMYRPDPWKGEANG